MLDCSLIDHTRWMGTWRSSCLILIAVSSFQRGTCGSSSLEYEAFRATRTLHLTVGKAGRSLRETLFGPRRNVLQGLQQCSSIAFQCPDGNMVRSDAYDAIVRGPCSPVPGLDLVRCGALLASKDVVDSVQAGVCELKCREAGSIVPCSATAAPPPSFFLRGLWT